MTDKEQRRLTLHLYPGETLGDKVAIDFVDDQRSSERGPAMRELLLAGAALSLIDQRLPRLVASTFDENMNLERLKSLINSVVPSAFSSVDLNSAVLAALNANSNAPAIVDGKNKVSEIQNVPEPEPTAVKSEEELRREETRKNGLAMLGDDDD